MRTAISSTGHVDAMEFIHKKIEGLVEVRLKVHSDARGRFKRHFCRDAFESAGLMTRVVQANHSVSLGRGTVRGMHYQASPSAEDKLVSCTFGRVFDVAVDLRPDSQTFLNWIAVELDDTVSLHIPKGCAHGFQTLTEESHLVYLHSEFYAPEAERGVRHDDPSIGVEWPLEPINISERDRTFALITKDFEGVRL